ncbi:hypothetical protein BDV93DRAFT_511874 [Ceratobasidium sp. AG-I]|nr:hypothetical protein BDV93DRAFT_511874 [Ceratobasidium sp. AG-I]
MDVDFTLSLLGLFHLLRFPGFLGLTDGNGNLTLTMAPATGTAVARHSPPLPNSLYISARSTIAAANPHTSVTGKDLPLMRVCGYSRTTSLEGCDRQGLKYQAPSKLATHLLTHIIHWAFKCELCGLDYKAQQHLVTHMSKHTPGSSHVCDFQGCKAVCATSESLEMRKIKHYKTDHNEKKL